MKNNTKKPNFFIIGAPKCGTTSLYRYLKEHPDIFMSDIKEPGYFATDLHRSITDKEKYLQLFEGAKDCKAVGEASTTYLYSEKAVDNILKFNPEAKFIVMTRDPVEMFHSLHSQNLNNLSENIKDPQKAWKLQKERKEGKHVPSTCQNPLFLQYGKVCEIGKYIEKLHEKISNKGKLQIIRLEDFKKETKNVYEKVLHFLDVKSNSKKEFPVYGSNSKLKMKGLKKISIKVSEINFVKKTSSLLKQTFGLHYWPFMRCINEWNQRKSTRTSLEEDFERKLKDYFKKDKKLLAKLLKRYGQR